MIGEETILNQPSVYENQAFKEMIDAGVFYGRKKTKTNPLMRHYILSNRGGIEIIDIHKTLEGLEKASELLKEKIKNGGIALFVGTQPAAGNLIGLAKEFNFPVVDRRWVGGTLTNFSTISKRVEQFKNLKRDLASGALNKYTKKERVEIEREIKRLDELIGGLEPMNRLPDVVIVIDATLHSTTVREANKLKIPVIAFGSTDTDPDIIDYLVVGNSAARKPIEWFLEKVADVIREAKKISGVAPQPEISNINGEQGTS